MDHGRQLNHIMSIGLPHKRFSQIYAQTLSTSKKVISTDSQLFKKLKKEVRDNELCIPDYVDYLFTSLKQADSERRYALFSLYDYFFNRSHIFRQKTVDKLQSLLLLVCETDPINHPLPGPSTERNELKVYAIKTVKQWHDKFGPGYYKLNFVSDFLRECKAVDYDAASAEVLAERRRREAELRKSEEVLQKVVTSVRRKFDETRSEIDGCIVSADTALSILVPLFFKDLDADGKCSCDATKSTATNTSNELAVHGLNSSETVSVVLSSLAPEVAVNEDNETLLENLRDTKVMLDGYRRKIISWQCKINGATNVELFMRDLTNLKRSIDLRLQKINEIKQITVQRRPGSTVSSESEESDLEDVPEKKLEDFVAPDEIPDHIMQHVQQREQEMWHDQPCCSNTLKPSASEEDHSEQKLRIPAVPYDLDLKYWGERIPPALVPRNIDDSHPFWRLPNDDDRPGLNELNNKSGELRVITWIGKPRRAEKRCKARLPSGKLCPRMDFHKCPLHGVIIARDEEGFPIEEVGATEQLAVPTQQQQKEEEEYLRDLEAGTGKSFLRKSRKTKKQESVRQRLEKKLLNPRVIKRVSAVLDAACKARLERNFGSQFAHLPST